MLSKWFQFRVENYKISRAKERPNSLCDWVTPPEWRLLKALYCWSASEEYAGALETLAGLSIDHLVSGTMDLCDTGHWTTEGTN